MSRHRELSIDEPPKRITAVSSTTRIRRRRIELRRPTVLTPHPTRRNPTINTRRTIKPHRLIRPRLNRQPLRTRHRHRLVIHPTTNHNRRTRRRQLHRTRHRTQRRTHRPRTSVTPRRRHHQRPRRNRIRTTPHHRASQPRHTTTNRRRRHRRRRNRSNRRRRNRSNRRRRNRSNRRRRSLRRRRSRVVVGACVVVGAWSSSELRSCRAVGSRSTVVERHLGRSVRRGTPTGTS